MKSIFEKLQNYFNNTSLEQVEKDWELTANFDKVNSPSVEFFIEKSSHYFEIDSIPPDLLLQNFFNTNLNPKFTSDFFLNIFHGKSKFLY